MIRSADENPPTLDLLEMTLQTQVGVSCREHLGIDRSVRAVTGGATFAHGFVLEHMRASLCRMTLEAGGVL